MKTIKEAASEFCKKSCIHCGLNEKDCGKLPEKCFEIMFNTFVAGANFAQRWISIDEELPETGISVLIKDKNGYVGLACRRYGDWDYKFKNMITHWRPITSK